jgi:hypothetical protein
MSAQSARWEAMTWVFRERRNKSRLLLFFRKERFFTSLGAASSAEWHLYFEKTEAKKMLVLFCNSDRQSFSFPDLKMRAGR